MKKIQKILAFDIGGTKVAYAIIDRKGKVVGDVVKKNTPTTTDAVYDILQNTVKSYENEVDAIAFSTAGTVNLENTRITGSVGNLPDNYMDTDFLSLTCKPVFVENDANCAVWAEYCLGGAKGYQNVVLMTLGTGVGVGIIVDGRLLKGKSGAAGEVHFKVRNDHHRLCGCGNYDCLEIYMSGTALNLDAREKFKDDNATSYDVIKGLKEHNIQAIEAFNSWQSSVLDGVITMADIFDPNIILLGGSMASFIDYEKLNEEANRRIVTAPFILKKAAFENNAGLIGAALRCVQIFEQK